MTVHPEEQSGDLRHGIHTAFLIAPLDHLLGGDVWHTVDRIADALGFRVEPTVALNETHTVSSALAKPVRQNEVSVVANTLRVLCQLCFVVAAGQHMTVGTPDIAPAGAVCFNCPLYQIQIVLGGGIVVVGVVDVGGTEVLGNAGEFLHGNACSELAVDCVDELGIRLILPEAGHQPGDEVGAAGVVVKRHDVQGLVRDLHSLTVADHFKAHRINGKKDLFHKVRPAEIETFSVELYDFVPDPESGGIFRTFLIYMIDGHLPHFGGIRGHTCKVDKSSHNKSEDDVEKGACCGSDDPVKSLGAGEFPAVGTFGDLIGGVDLRKLHISAEGQIAQTVLHAVDLFAPERFEPQRKGVNMKFPPFSGEKMPQLMGKDTKSDRNKNKHQRTDDTQDVQQ